MTRRRTCVRCMDDRPATVELRVQIGDTPGDLLDLCDDHHRRFCEVTYAWVRLGRPVPEKPEREPWKPAAWRTPDGPVRLRPPREVDSDFTPPQLTTKRPRDAGWKLSSRAVADCAKEGVTPDEALAVAEQPRDTLRSRGPGEQVHLRGSVAVVVRVADRTITSVLPRVALVTAAT